MKTNVVRYEHLHLTDYPKEALKDKAKIFPLSLHLFGRDPVQACSLHCDRRSTTNEVRLLRETCTPSIQHLPREQDQRRELHLLPYLFFVEHILSLRIEDEVVRLCSLWRWRIKERGRIDIDLYGDRCLLSP